MNVLIVRLGALGDVVHTVPAAAALRRAYPQARIDWVVEAKYLPFADLITCLDGVIPLERQNVMTWIDVVRHLRAGRYDVAIDFQGLMKSAVIARASGARRVVGFSIWHLREKGARPLYSEVEGEGGEAHVVRKNLALLAMVGITGAAIEFPLARRYSPALEAVREALDGGPFALLNPGAAWPNKQWAAARFGEVADFLRDVRGLPSLVLWGPGEAPLAQAVIDSSGGAARLAPPTTTADLVELARAAAILVSGDTGPLHIAASVGTPIVAIFGPTDPLRNGPWCPADAVVSRYAVCRCPYQRRCHQAARCLDDVPVAEVTAAIQHRLAIHE